MRHYRTQRPYLTQGWVTGIATLLLSTACSQAWGQAPLPPPLPAQPMNQAVQPMNQAPPATLPVGPYPDPVPKPGSVKREQMPVAPRVPAPLATEPITGPTLNPPTALPPGVMLPQGAGAPIAINADGSAMQADGQNVDWQSQRPVVVYMPPGWQPHGYQPWPGGGITYAPNTELNSEVSDDFWPSRNREPLSMTTRPLNAQASTGGMFRWPKVARIEGSAPPAPRPPVPEPKSMFAQFFEPEQPATTQTQTGATTTASRPKSRALFARTPKEPQPLPKPPAPNRTADATPQQPAPPTVLDKPSVPAPRPIPPAAAPVQTTEPIKMRETPVERKPSIEPAQTPALADAQRPEAPASQTKLTWRAKGAPRKTEAISEPVNEPAPEPIETRQPQIVTPVSAERPEPPSSTIQAAPRPVRQQPAEPRTFQPQPVPRQAPARQKALLSLSMFQKKPEESLDQIFSAPQNPGKSKALLAGQPPRMQRPTASAAPTPARPMQPTPMVVFNSAPNPQQRSLLNSGARQANHMTPAAGPQPMPAHLSYAGPPPLDTEDIIWDAPGELSHKALFPKLGGSKQKQTRQQEQRKLAALRSAAQAPTSELVTRSPGSVSQKALLPQFARHSGPAAGAQPAHVAKQTKPHLAKPPAQEEELVPLAMGPAAAAVGLIRQKALLSFLKKDTTEEDAAEEDGEESDKVAESEPAGDEDEIMEEPAARPPLKTTEIVAATPSHRKVGQPGATTVSPHMTRRSFFGHPIAEQVVDYAPSDEQARVPAGRTADVTPDDMEIMEEDTTPRGGWGRQRSMMAKPRATARPVQRVAQMTMPEEAPEVDEEADEFGPPTTVRVVRQPAKANLAPTRTSKPAMTEWSQNRGEPLEVRKRNGQRVLIYNPASTMEEEEPEVEAPQPSANAARRRLVRETSAYGNVNYPRPIR